jgi:hypothetical protein
LSSPIAWVPCCLLFQPHSNHSISSFIAFNATFASCLLCARKHNIRACAKFVDTRLFII